MDEILATLASIVGSATPLIFASIGETITEKAGVVNLSLNGSMALSAMSGFAVAFYTENLWLGFLVAAAISAASAALVACSGIWLRLNQVAVGFVLTLFLASLADFLGSPVVRKPGPFVPAWDLPLLADIPWVGTVFFSHNLSVYAALLLVILASLGFRYTSLGLRLTAVGERPEAAHSRGISVWKYRLGAALIGGALVGIAGAAFSLDVKAGWSDGHIDGFGWIALAIVIFGGWRPGWVAFGCFLFGGLQVLALELQPVFPDLAQILPTMPFPLMIFTLVVVNSKTIQRLGDRNRWLGRIMVRDIPGALGTNFRA